MAIVRMRGPLKQLSGGGEHTVAGASVGDLLVALEQAHPPLRGWILDERGELRRHINVWVNGELARQSTPVRAEDRVDVLPALSGG
jgi:sulfur-carrier protein